jgi:multidrug transporter EmrE-like cation transporter
MLGWQIIALILVAVACSAFAQIGLKAGMSQPGVQAALGGSQGPVAVALAITASPGVWGGLFLYGLSALLWLFVLARVEVSVAYAFVALGFLLVMALGVALLGEALTWRKVLGTLLVAAGIWLVATGGGGAAAVPAAEGALANGRRDG